VLLLFAAVLAVSSFKILADGGDDDEVGDLSRPLSRPLSSPYLGPYLAPI